MNVVSYVLDRLLAFYVDGFSQIISSLVIGILIALAVLLLELLFVPWRCCSLRRLLRPSATVRTDALAFFLVETNLALFMGMAMFFGVTYMVHRHAISIVASHGPWRFGPLWLSVVLFFVVNDLANYWSHRLCHRVPLLWHIHRYHHSAPQMTVLTAARDHPMERAFAAMVSALPAALMGLPSDEFLLLFLLAKAVGFFKHSNLISNWGWFGRFFVQSPAAHWIHHSTDPAHHDRNFASLFQFWDIVFGTAYHPTQSEAKAIVLGVDGDNGQLPALRYIGRIFVDFIRLIVGARNV